MNTLMAEIRALGRIPRGNRMAEHALFMRLYYAKRHRMLSESQLAELTELAACDLAKLPGSRSTEPVLRAGRCVAAEGMLAQSPELMNTLMTEVRALGHIPRCSVEGPLYQRLYKARIHGKLSESQLTELA